MRTRFAAGVAGVLAAALLGGCGNASQAAPARAGAQPAAAAPGTVMASRPCGTKAKPGRYRHVIWIWMENQSYGTIIGSSQAPYISTLARECGLATNYHEVTHPSLPNYIAATSGLSYPALHGFLPDCGPGAGCRAAVHFAWTHCQRISQKAKGILLSVSNIDPLARGLPRRRAARGVGLMLTDEGALPHPVDRVNAWVLTGMAGLNEDILARRRPPGDLGAELSRSVLADLPPPESLPPRQAQRLVVLMGLAGASVSRHYQELDRSHRAAPERAFDPCPVGIETIPFLAYFGRLAERTGTGHCHRDSYAALTRWNVPTTEVWWAGERLAVLTGLFGDGRVRTYGGSADERRFFELIKVSEAIERAVNAALMPISDATLDVRHPEALDRVGLAAVLLEALRRLNAHFAALPPHEGLHADHFMDVFRQYAAHWTPGDIPPSGAADPEAIARDCLLGIGTPSYAAHTKRIFPALLDAERGLLTRLTERPSVPETALRSLGLDALTLARTSPAQLRKTVGRHPVLAALYLLLVAHARMSGLHLKIAKKYLFAPQRRREAAGLGDPGVVSNRLGTTGMDERYLEELTRTRHRHALACLHAIGGHELECLAGLDRVRAESPDLGSLIRFTVPATGQGGLGDWLPRPRESPRGRDAETGHGGAAGEIITTRAGDDGGIYSGRSRS
jgi:hypothetical protein